MHIITIREKGNEFKREQSDVYVSIWREERDKGK